MKELTSKNSRLELQWMNEIFNLLQHAPSYDVWRGSGYVFALLFGSNRRRILESTEIQENTYSANQMTGFYMKCNLGLKWVNEVTKKQNIF